MAGRRQRMTRDRRWCRESGVTTGRRIQSAGRCRESGIAAGRRIQSAGRCRESGIPTGRRVESRWQSTGRCRESGIAAGGRIESRWQAAGWRQIGNRDDPSEGALWLCWCRRHKRSAPQY
jgi:hypothetical protein